MNEVEIVAPARALLGESPVWDDQRHHLLWVDILRGQVHRFDPASGLDGVTCQLPMDVGAVRLATDGSLVLAAGLGVAHCEETSGALTWWGHAGIGDRMNDATCDPAGRFWAGTLTVEGPGAALYRLDAPGRLTTVFDDVGLSNGLAWSSDATLAYYVDTLAEQVYVFDADVAAGSLSNRRVFADLHDVPGRPDGLTVDADGGVWVATAKGGAIRRYAADGTVDEVIDIGAPRVTSCAFGGPTLSDLYVTTMCVGMDEPELREYPRAGALLRIPDVGVRGLPSHRVKLF